MDFSLNEEQELFRKTVHDWVERERPKNVARDLEAQEFEYPFGLWDKMTEAGFHAIGLPEEYDGQGGDVITQVILGRELARSLAGLTWIWGISSFCAKSVEPLRLRRAQGRAAPAARRRRHPHGHLGHRAVGAGTDLLGGDEDDRHQGRRRLPDHRLEDLVDRGPRVASTCCCSPAPTRRRREAGQGRHDLPRAQPGRGPVDPADPEGRACAASARARSSSTTSSSPRSTSSARSTGAGTRCWRRSTTSASWSPPCAAGSSTACSRTRVEYLLERRAFGKQIGAFQALQHYVADIAMWQRQAELVTYYAAWKYQTGQPGGVESTMCKVLASEYAGKAADLGLQMLGGMGYAAETNMQRYWRDARLYRIGPDHQRDGPQRHRRVLRPRRGRSEWTERPRRPGRPGHRRRARDRRGHRRPAGRATGASVVVNDVDEEPADGQRPSRSPTTAVRRRRGGRRRARPPTRRPWSTPRAETLRRARHPGQQRRAHPRRR